MTGRRPFGRDDVRDYDVDSEDDWEEEPEDGEQLSVSSVQLSLPNHT